MGDTGRGGGGVGKGMSWSRLVRQHKVVLSIVAALVLLVVLYAGGGALRTNVRYLTSFSYGEPTGKSVNGARKYNRRVDVCAKTRSLNGPAAFKPDEKSLSTHSLPKWFGSARFGIFIHWGLYSVPGWAETAHSFADFKKGVTPETHFFHNPYSEWYLNTARLKDSGAQKHHIDTYRENPQQVTPKKWYYERFSREFDVGLENWRPDEWAKLFADSGAGYVVLTTKHHDGFCLWPTQVSHPKWGQFGGGPRHPMKRDLVGELSKAVRAEGLQMGLYYSGGLDWSFHWPIDTCFDDPTGKALCHPGVPKSKEYAAYAGAQLRELIERYKPAILWNDIDWPELGKFNLRDPNSLPNLFTKYLNDVCKLGIVNERWHLNKGSTPWKWTGDFGTPEYSDMDKVQAKVFETCRGIGKSFGFNRVEEQSKNCKAYMTVNEVVELLITTVAKNGNLLLDVGPDENGHIPKCQQNVLRGVGAWLDVYHQAVLNTQPWLKAGSIIVDGDPVRYMKSQDSKTAYAIVLAGRVRSVDASKKSYLTFFSKIPMPNTEFGDFATVWLPDRSKVKVRIQHDASAITVFLPWQKSLQRPSNAWVFEFVHSSKYDTSALDCRQMNECTEFA
eukprot:scpid41972/ scgid16173/ Alpha-L-fucosidase; Alpha-L-fucoside fucohydrolase